MNTSPSPGQHHPKPDRSPATALTSMEAARTASGGDSFHGGADADGAGIFDAASRPGSRSRSRASSFGLYFALASFCTGGLRCEGARFGLLLVPRDFSR